LPEKYFLENVVVRVWLASGALASGALASYVAGLRRQDKLDGLTDGLLLGPLGVALVTFRKEPVPDIDVQCPHCSMRQAVGGDLQWFECWQCEQESDVPTPSTP
jgi:hypothetical protein